MSFDGAVDFGYGSEPELKEIYSHYKRRGWRAFGLEAPTVLFRLFPNSCGLIVARSKSGKEVVGYVVYDYHGKGGVHIDAIGVKENFAGYLGTRLLNTAEEMIKQKRKEQGLRTAYFKLVPALRVLRNSSKLGKKNVLDPQEVRARWFRKHGYVQKEKGGLMVKMIRKIGSPSVKK